MTNQPTAETVQTAALAWMEANQRYLSAHLARIRAALEQHAGQSPQVTAEAAPVMAHDHPAALDTLCEMFDLSPFERDLLLLCAGVELEAIFAPLCASAQGDPARDYPTFSLALAALPGAHWNALSPAAPLRHWQMLRIEPARALTLSPLRIDERILDYLMGVQHMEEGLAGLLHRVPPAEDLVPSHAALAREIAATWSQAASVGSLPVIQLCGPQVEGKRAVAASACDLLGFELYRMPLMALPGDPAELDRLLLLWAREAALADSVLLIDGDGSDTLDPAREAILARVVEASYGPLLLSSRERRGPWVRPAITYEIAKPTGPEQRAIWQSALKAAALNASALDASAWDAGALDGAVDRLTAQFNLNPSVITATAQSALGHLASAEVPAEADSSALVGAVSDVLWDQCRAQIRPQLDDLAQRIQPAAGWADLILPQAQLDLLHEICMHVRQRAQVYEAWDFQSKGRRGLGISALFAGLSGTGKTMAAEVLASELRLDLYRIDLSAVVSKYIGETEKNLRRLFDAAEDGGTILFFDEADALFGKRSEVKDSHDRYANIEVSYLLTRIEAYRGLAILTTNLKDALDAAFLRRIRFIVQFPFPDLSEREAIWRGIFPTATPVDGLNPTRLAQLNLAGGDIRNIALQAAFLAAEAGEPVRMAHVLRATRHEYKKLERTLTSAEIRGWDESKP